MEWYESEVRSLERACQQQALPECPAVFYGSSSIRGWDTLAEDLGDPRALNLGFGGSTLEACVFFFERLIVPVRPASLIVYAGDNDLGDGRHPAQVIESYRALLTKVRTHLGTAPFGFIAIKPSPARRSLLSHIREANDGIRREAAHHPSAFFVDVFEPMLSPRGEPRPELFLADGLHMARAGYALWTDVLRPFRHRVFTLECSPLHTETAGSIGDGSRIPPLVQPSPRT
jgi:lysophospholipase L1-like esterase